MKIKFIYFLYFFFCIFLSQNTFAKHEIPSEIKITIEESQYKDFLKQYVILVKNNRKGLLNPKDIKQNVRAEILKYYD